MSSAKLAALSGLAAIVVAGCGTTAKPLAGTPGIAHLRGIRGRIDDPRTAKANRIKCIAGAGLPVTPVGTSDLKIGSAPGDPYVHFESTPGAAQGVQLSGASQPAEAIGAALLYPGSAPDSELQAIENCLSEGVSG